MVSLGTTSPGPDFLAHLVSIPGPGARVPGAPGPGGPECRTPVAAPGFQVEYWG